MDRKIAVAIGCCLSEQCFAANGYFQHDNSWWQYGIPLMGYLIVFVFMVATERALLATAVSFGLLLLFVIGVFLFNIFAFAVFFIVGPWVLFLALLLACFIPEISMTSEPNDRGKRIPNDPSPWNKLP